MGGQGESRRRREGVEQTLRVGLHMSYDSTWKMPHTVIQAGYSYKQDTHINLVCTIVPDTRARRRASVQDDVDWCKAQSHKHKHAVRRCPQSPCLCVLAMYWHPHEQSLTYMDLLCSPTPVHSDGCDDRSATQQHIACCTPARKQRFSA